MRMFGAVVMTGCLLAGAAVQARELAGVKMDETMKVGDAELKLNGMGVRTKKVAFVSVKVYVGGLYLTAPATKADAAIGPDAPKALVMQFVRDVDKGKLVDAWKEGFQNNSPDKVAAQKAAIDRFLAFVVDVKDGQRITWLYEPGKGSTITIGAKSVTVEGKEFADMFLATYIGRDPPTADFKTALLAGK
ncbi:MAG: chalcone isomerase family protein [Deltaproteobacteria bacterium]|nr:chalcone isomerase family protein [Deltaproteobacteria bacterium]